MRYADLPKELRPTEHPVYPVLPEAELSRVLEAPDGHVKYAEWLNRRERLIRCEREDPLRYGHELEPIWQDARELLTKGNDVLILGGNRSSKTEFAAKVMVETLQPNRLDLDKPVSVWAFQEDERASIERQQTYVYRILPPELRNIGKKGRITNICYTVKNGFSEGIFVLPNGSLARFMSYCMDPRSLEGAELDLCWCDELVPADMLETLRYRLVTRGGKMLVTFTPLQGYSVAVKQYLEGARVVRSLPAPLLPQDQVLVPGCPRGHMPYVLECSTPGRWVILFHTAFNLFNPYQNLVNLVKDAPLADKKIRAYGWPEKQIAGAFPKFGDVHVVPHGTIPATGTNYRMADPGGAKAWCILWARVDDLGRIYVYREWPDQRQFGEWALPSDKPDGKPGPAQRAGSGLGILAIKALVLKAEGWTYDDQAGWSPKPDHEVIFNATIDPRAGSAQVPGIEEGTSIVDLLFDEQINHEGVVWGPSMPWTPSPACRVEEGTQLINDLLDYNEEQPLSAVNSPKLFISDLCPNLIYCLRTWTGADGERGASKDPIDALKYGVKTGLGYVDMAFKGIPGGGW